MCLGVDTLHQHLGYAQALHYCGTATAFLPPQVVSRRSGRSAQIEQLAFQRNGSQVHDSSSNPHLNPGFHRHPRPLFTAQACKQPLDSSYGGYAVLSKGPASTVPLPEACQVRESSIVCLTSIGCKVLSEHGVTADRLAVLGDCTHERGLCAELMWQPSYLWLNATNLWNFPVEGIPCT